MGNFKELEKKELTEVEGGGLLGAVVGGVVGFVVGVPVGLTSYTVGRLTGSVSNSQFSSVMKDSMLASAGVGILVGSFSPTP